MWLTQSPIEEKVIKQYQEELIDNWELIELSNVDHSTEFILWAQQKEGLNCVLNNKVRPFFLKEEIIMNFSIVSKMTIRQLDSITPLQLWI